jgi:hypothetical protein
MWTIDLSSIRIECFVPIYYFSNSTAISFSTVFKKPMNLRLIEKPDCFLFNSVFFWRLAIYVRRILSCFDGGYKPSSGEKSHSSSVTSIHRNSHEGFKTFPRCYCNRRGCFHTAYLSSFFITKKPFHKEMFKDAADQLYKQYEHLWPIEIKSTLN